jgi:hypothetical protein
LGDLQRVTIVIELSLNVELLSKGLELCPKPAVGFWNAAWKLCSLDVSKAAACQLKEPEPLRIAFASLEVFPSECPDGFDRSRPCMLNSRSKLYLNAELVKLWIPVRVKAKHKMDSAIATRGRGLHIVVEPNLLVGCPAPCVELRDLLDIRVAAEYSAAASYVLHTREFHLRRA